jgi:hypothetical protein
MPTQAVVLAIYAGGPGSGCNPKAGTCGRHGGGEETSYSPGTGLYMPRSESRPFGKKEQKTVERRDKIDKARQERARASFNPVTAEKIAIAKANEDRLAVAIGGQSFADNYPFDVMKGRERGIGIEVKTIFPGAKNDKVTMHPASRVRKEDLRDQLRLKKVYTVVFDRREGVPDKMYIKEGVGAYRLANMTPMKNLKATADAITKMQRGL